MEKPHLKERFEKGEIVLGTWNIIPSPSLIEVIGHSGLDFIVIDSEHGPVNMESAENLIRAAEVAGISPIIRVSGNESYQVLRALDIGAHGVQVPHVSTKRDAELTVEYSKYHPIGKRGLSPFTRAGRYGTDADKHTIRSNEETMLIINIEGANGIKNLKEIMSVNGIDVIFIGPYDLSQSIGKPGKVNDPEVKNIIKKTAKAVKENGLVCGSFARDMKYLEFLIDCRIQYITYMVDTAIILQSYKNINDSFMEIKKGLRK